MGNWMSTEAPPRVVLVPPLFDGPQFATRSRMAASSYEILFSKVARKALFSDYYAQADQLLARIMLKPPEDPNVDFIATVSIPAEEKFNGDAVFRWQRDAEDPNTFMELDMSTSTKALKVRACTFNHATGLGTFLTFPIISERRLVSEDQNVIGLRYGSSNLSIGTTMDFFFKGPSRLWLVGKLGKITAGCQYKPHQFPTEARRAWTEYPLDAFQNPKNWSFAVDYGSGKRCALNPGFNFCLEAQEHSKLSASYYHHLIVQRQVRNPFEGEEVIAITNYIDIGFEFQQSLEGSKPSSSKADNELPTMQIGASWQANKNFLLKAKLGMFSTGVAFMFKSWWQPSFTFSCSAVRDHIQKGTKLSLGLQVENLRGVSSYERADPNYVMVIPTKEHLAEGMLKDPNARPFVNTDVTSENMKESPAEFRPSSTIL